MDLTMCRNIEARVNLISIIDVVSIIFVSINLSKFLPTIKNCHECQSIFTKLDVNKNNMLKHYKPYL